MSSPQGSPIRVNPELSIPRKELWFQASRSGGPGGQNVNKVNTRVALFFDVQGSPSLSAAQRERLQRRLGSRLSGQGVLQVVCQRHRSQAANRRGAEMQLARLLAQALRRPRPRRPTRLPAGVKRRRLEEKRRRGRLKRSRRRPLPEED